MIKIEIWISLNYGKMHIGEFFINPSANYFIDFLKKFGVSHFNMLCSTTGNYEIAGPWAKKESFTEETLTRLELYGYNLILLFKNESTALKFAEKFKEINKK